MTKNSADVDDYQHAIAEIRRSLHSDKAAVLVGAGFSRNARPIGNHTRSFPDWKELTLALADRLYPDNKRREDVVREAGATSAALRLAQEFEVAFGRSALLDLVRDTVRDRDYEPGPLHCQLLELPWADIFTTNYDTLLVRAAETVWRRKYDVVESVGDLPIARRPRIVKLHGSLPGLRDLVLTEGDYRQYPGRYAPLVNAVRGSLSENVFCLIGFSGTDPNFLAWTGWIRDELQASSPYIYLFTADDLTTFQRRLLEDRRIIPIPIRDLAGEKESFSQAYAWLFDALRFPPGGPPTPSWNIRPRYVTREADPSIADEPWNRSGDGAVQWVDTAAIWRKHRLQYKGWHVLHRDGIERIWTSTEFWLSDLSAKVAADWSAAEAVFILSELAWRCARALVPLPDTVVFEILDAALARYRDWRADLKEDETSLRGTANELKISLKELDIAAFRIRLELLRHAREIGMGTRFKQIEQEVCFSLKTTLATEIPDATHFVEQQRILFLLAQFNHEEARTRLAKWDTSAADPIWSIRKAGLCLECGLRDEGPQLVFTVLSSIRRNGLSRKRTFECCLSRGSPIARPRSGPIAGFRSQKTMVRPRPRPARTGRHAQRSHLPGAIAHDAHRPDKV